MKVVVTGATSMIGVAIIKECINNNDTVLAIVRNDTKRLERLPNSKNIKILYSDLSDLKNINCDGERYDVFYHLAWDYTIKQERDNPVLQEDNIRYSLDSVFLAYKLGCKKYIGAGSQAEYGIVPGKINPDTIPNPQIAYGMAKLSSYYLCGKLCNQFGIKFIWARVFSVYGINDNDGTMINYALTQFCNKEKAFFSSGTQIWNYLFEDDAGILFYLLGVKEVNNGVYCIASLENKVLRKYIEEILDLFENQKISWEFLPEAKEKKINLNVDISKTVLATGYVPKIRFKEGIKKVMETKFKYC